jgi:hypothetical protein
MVPVVMVVAAAAAIWISVGEKFRSGFSNIFAFLQYDDS